MDTVTSDMYRWLNRAFRYFNARLFDDRLPAVAITLQHHRSHYGYFNRHRFRNGSGHTAGEIALNPEFFLARTPTEILGTLVHEMVHLEQHTYGNPSRNGYHNREFGKMMRSVGLIASNTGQPGGKATGQQMTHYIEGGGIFARQCEQFLRLEVVQLWGSPHQALPDEGQTLESPGNTNPKSSKATFHCPNCKQVAWAKQTANLKCGVCDLPMFNEESQHNSST